MVVEEVVDFLVVGRKPAAKKPVGYGKWVKISVYSPWFISRMVLST